MWKVFAVIVLIGGITGDGEDVPAEYASKKAYPTKEACQAVIPGARKFWEERIAGADSIKGKDGKPIKGKDGKVVEPKLKIKKIYCSNEEIIK